MSKLVEIDWNPSERVLRQFGAFALVGFGLLAWTAWSERFVFAVGLGAARVPVALGFCAIGIVSACFALVAPRCNRPIFVGLSLIAYPVGWIISRVLLGALFFGLFAPVALVFRILGRDPLQRSFDPRAPSYWSVARPPRDRADYFRQF